MDPSEITKHLPEALSLAKVAVGSIPFTGIVKRMLGPAADELAERFRDGVRVYRYGRQLRLLEKAESMAATAGFIPDAVPIKILFPLLEGASLEENEELHTMWAALFANASSPDHAHKIRPGFIATLKQLSIDEATMLKYIYNEAGILKPEGLPLFEIADVLLETFYQNQGFEEEFETCMDSLSAEFLVTRSAFNNGYKLTSRGMRFFEACQPPARKASRP